MQTTTLFERLTEISEVLDTQELEQLVQTVLFETNQPASPLAKKFGQLIFAARSRLDQLALDPDNAEIIKRFGLGEIFADDRLGGMIAAINSAGMTESISGGIGPFALFFRFFVLLKDLHRFAAALESLVILPRHESTGPDEEELSFEVVDVSGRGITIDRFQSILVTIASLHNTVSHVLGTDAGLSIAYLDSGSNSLITVKSDGKSIGEVRKLIFGVWDRIRYGKYVDHTKKMEAAAAGLELLEQINDKEKNGELDAATASQFRHLAVQDTLSLFGQGATLKEIQVDTTIDNRKLLLDNVDTKYLEDKSAAPAADGSPEQQR